jgi:hypothetical protein
MVREQPVHHLVSVIEPASVEGVARGWSKEAIMTTKDLIQTEIERLSEEHLEELYSLIREFARSRTCVSDQSLMSKLRSIEIAAPADFAANLDLYTTGEKGGQPHLR